MASSSERSEALELLEAQNDEGPCFESYQLAQPIFSEDLTADAERWPAFAPLALEKGFLSVHAIPMRVRGETVGALNLFRDEAGRLAASDLPLGQGLADIAAVALLQERIVREARGVVQQLQEALTSRVVIEQAKGVLAERAGIDVDEAFARMRTTARARNARLSDLARALIDGELDAASLQPSPT